jgi:outer membrane translocation and assembly module TamA
VDWLIDGNFLHAQFYGNFWGRWYAGPVVRFVDVNQTFGSEDAPETFATSAETKAIGAGVNFEYDHRDMPLNTYDGNIFQLKTLFNDEALGSDSTYQSYDFSYRSYHEMKQPVVLAWELKACRRAGDVPLWDMCRIPLRGFSATDYLGKKSVSAQVEARWRMSKRWGMVGFAGGGYIVNTYAEDREREVIPSYGVGFRFMVLPAKRINLRLDFAWSTDSDAIYFSAGEAF